MNGGAAIALFGITLSGVVVVASASGEAVGSTMFVPCPSITYTYPTNGPVTASANLRGWHRMESDSPACGLSPDGNAAVLQGHGDHAVDGAVRKGNQGLQGRERRLRLHHDVRGILLRHPGPLAICSTS